MRWFHPLWLLPGFSVRELRVGNSMKAALGVAGYRGNYRRRSRGPVQSFMADLSVIVVFSSPPLPLWLQGSWQAAIRQWLNKLNTPHLQSLYYSECIYIYMCVCLCVLNMTTKQVSPMFNIISVESCVSSVSRDNGWRLQLLSHTRGAESSAHHWEQEQDS